MGNDFRRGKMKYDTRALYGVVAPKEGESEPSALRWLAPRQYVEINRETKELYSYNITEYGDIDYTSEGILLQMNQDDADIFEAYFGIDIKEYGISIEQIAIAAHRDEEDTLVCRVL